MNGPNQVFGIAQRKADTAHASQWLHDFQTRWRSLLPIKCRHRVPKEKQNLCAGMAREQPISQSHES